jgi:uncharacterized protein (DUF2147 family)
MKNLLKCSILIILFSLYFSGSVFAQTPSDTTGSIVGKWKTIDDKTNEPKAIVEIYQEDGKYFGKITKLFRKPGEDPKPVCDECPDKDPRFNQPIIGMVIVKDLVQKGKKYKGGTILDTKEGKIYKCKVWTKGETLMVRGYIAFFFRTQTWHKVE